MSEFAWPWNEYDAEHARLVAAWTAHYVAKGCSPHKAANVAWRRCQFKRTYPQAVVA